MLPSIEQFFTILPLILFLFFLYKWLHTKSSLGKSLPPSPPRIPIIGNLHQLGNYPYRSLKPLSERYGELMVVYMGKAPVLIVSSAKAAREIMKTQDSTFCNRPISKFRNKLLYNGKDVAAAQYGEYWRLMKSICVLQLLSSTRVRSFRSVREEEMALLMEKIEKSSSSVVNLSEMFMTLTNDVVCRVAFGRKYSKDINFMKLLREYLELLGSFRVGDFIPCLAWTNWLSGSDAKADRVVKEFDNFLELVVKEHQDRQGDSRKGEDSQNDVLAKDFVDVLLDVQKENTAGFAIDRDSIKGVILDIFSGGTDTTATVLEWAMTELLRHPLEMSKLQREVRGITGEKAFVNEDDLGQMKYLKAVIKETLRLHPPIPFLSKRRSIHDTKINGYDIPAGITVLTNAWVIHRDPASWDEPERFNPERFLDSTTDFKGQDFDLIPFGSGRRICPGITFAIANNELVLANLMHKFNWILPGKADGETLDMSECIGLTAHWKIPLLATATPVIEGNNSIEEDLEHIKYLKAVVMETLQLHLPVPLSIHRQLTQATKVFEYNIPARTGVIINGWAIHRDPASWDEPDKFNPESFELPNRLHGKQSAFNSKSHA